MPEEEEAEAWTEGRRELGDEAFELSVVVVVVAAVSCRGGDEVGWGCCWDDDGSGAEARAAATPAAPTTMGAALKTDGEEGVDR